MARSESTQKYLDEEAMNLHRQSASVNQNRNLSFYKNFINEKDYQARGYSRPFSEYVQEVIKQPIGSDVSYETLFPDSEKNVAAETSSSKVQQQELAKKETNGDDYFYSLYSPYYKSMLTPEDYAKTGETDPYQYYVGKVRDLPIGSDVSYYSLYGAKGNNTASATNGETKKEAEQQTANPNTKNTDPDFYSIYSPYYKNMMTPEEYSKTGETDPYQYYVGKVKDLPIGSDVSYQSIYQHQSDHTGSSSGTGDNGDLRKYSQYAAGNIDEWYRAHFGTEFDGTMPTVKPGGMSTGDWINGLNAYSLWQNSQLSDKLYNERKENLQKWYDNQIDALSASTGESKEQATMLYNRLLKYLPVQNRALGISNLGIAQSTGARALSAYSQRLGEIASQENQQRNAISSQRFSKEQSLEDAYGSELKSRLDAESSLRNSRYNEIISQDEENETNAVNNLSMAIKSGVSADRLRSMLAEYEKYLSPENKLLFESLIDQESETDGTKQYSKDEVLNMFDEYVKLYPEPSVLNNIMASYLSDPSLDQKTKQYIRETLTLYESAYKNTEDESVMFD